MFFTLTPHLAELSDYGERKRTLDGIAFEHFGKKTYFVNGGYVKLKVDPLVVRDPTSAFYNCDLSALAPLSRRETARMRMDQSLIISVVMEAMASNDPKDNPEEIWKVLRGEYKF